MNKIFIHLLNTVIRYVITTELSTCYTQSMSNNNLVLNVQRFQGALNINSSTNNIKMTNFHLFTIFLLFVPQSSICDICSTCSCSNQLNEAPVIDCQGKHFANNDMLTFDLLSLNENQVLNKLVLSNNDIIHLPVNLFKKLRHLKTLDLSENIIEEIHVSMFVYLNNLQNLKISKNVLRNFDDSLFDVLPSLQLLNLSYNHINSIEYRMNSTARKITVLDLSHNNVTSMPKQFTESLSILQYLDLSYNRIQSIQDCSLVQLKSLETLYINNNFLLSLDMKMLPQSLYHLYAGYNNISEMLNELPPYIEILNIEYNKIPKIQKNFVSNNLHYLNIRGNMLTSFPNIVLKSLRVLDISHNKLTYIPETISIKNCPLLTKLNVSNNPIQNLKLPSDLKLSVFVANNLDLLQIIDKDTLINLQAPSKDCINLIISNNKLLSVIHEDAMEHLNLCSLDLSNNQLSHLTHKISTPNCTPPTCTINLQGNPFHCNCSLQWMLNDLVPKLYSSQPSLLENLRCASPPQISKMRMVHWYGWEDQILCSNISNLTRNLTLHAAYSDIGPPVTNEVVQIESSFGVIAIIGSALAILIILVIIGIVWNQKVYRRRRRINRKF